MPGQRNEPAEARENCLEALAIAIPILCKNQQFNDPIYNRRHRYNQFHALRLCCKRLRQIVDELWTSLWVRDGQTDFDILTPALLNNIRQLDIFPNGDEHKDLIRNHLPDLHRILHLTAPNLHRLNICRVPALLAVLIKGLAFPNLEELSLVGIFYYR